MSDIPTLADEYTIIIRVDTSRPRDNVAVDLGALPPAFALEPLRQAFDAVSDILEGEVATLWFRQELVEQDQEMSGVEVDDDE